MMKNIYEVKTDKSFEDAVAAFKEAIEANNFSILFELDFKATFAGYDIEFDKDYIIFDICDAKSAKAMLDENLQIGYALPCKGVVYNDGKEVRIGAVKLADNLADIDSSVVKKEAQDDQNRLQKAVDAAAAQ